MTNMEKAQLSAIPKKELIVVIIVMLLMAFMELTGLPSTLFVHVTVDDIDPTYPALLVNFVLSGFLCLIALRVFCPHWKLGLHAKGLFSHLLRYGIVGVVFALVTLISLLFTLQPFDVMPTVGKVLIEGFIYYIALGIIEEIYLRGMLLNLFRMLFGKRKNPALWAVIVSSVIFGIGHIFGELGNPPLQIACKVIWTICLGIYLGAIYVRSGNLWVPIILHMLVNFAVFPILFSSMDGFPTPALLAFLCSYITLGVFGVLFLVKGSHQDE